MRPRDSRAASTKVLVDSRTLGRGVRQGQYAYLRTPGPPVSLGPGLSPASAASWRAERVRAGPAMSWSPRRGRGALAVFGAFAMRFQKRPADQIREGRRLGGILLAIHRREVVVMLGSGWP